MAFRFVCFECDRVLLIGGCLCHLGFAVGCVCCNNHVCVRLVVELHAMVVGIYMWI